MMAIKMLTTKGTLHIDETTVRLVALFNQEVWAIARESINRVIAQQDMLMADIVFVTERELYLAPGVAKKQVEKLLAEFPGQTRTVRKGLKWYQDMSLTSHVETYKDEAVLNREIVEAAKFGWETQMMAGTAGHVNVGRTATAAALTGGVSLLFGASRSKDKLTLSFERPIEWFLQEH